MGTAHPPAKVEILEGWVTADSVPLVLDPPLGIDGSHATAPGCGDRLSVGEILDVTTGKNTIDTGTGTFYASDIAIVVQFDLAIEQLSVRSMTDRDK
jgi:hypothetical protein